jgi:hypothetical protein
MDIGGDVAGGDGTREHQPIAGLARGERVEVGCRIDRAAGSGHGQHMHRRRNLRAHRLQVFPDLEAGRRPQRHDDPGPGRADELDEVLGLEHPVDAAGDTTTERAEHRDKELRHRRQHVKYDIIGPDAEAVE